MGLRMPFTGSINALFHQEEGGHNHQQHLTAKTSPGLDGTFFSLSLQLMEEMELALDRSFGW
jgi:hypothetical protein